MVRWVSGAAALFLLLVATQPAHEAHAAGGKDKVGGKCEQKQKRSLFGSIAGEIASSALGRAGVGNSVGGVYLPVNSLLSEGLTRLLNCKEQQQAAQATQEAVRGGVGSSASWQSESRPNVSGSSTVTGQTARADGASCLTVSDVVIVNGEETTVPKTMCRAPGASGYTLAA
jgi:hypothetical protein